MKLVVLDRDGVINRDSDRYIKTVDEWVPIDGSIEAITSLQQAGFTIAIATNQSGIGRGYYSQATLHAMHQKMNTLLLAAGGAEIQTIAFCPHTPDDHCDCRKPKPGLLDQIQQQLGLTSLQGMTLVGDSLRDLQAARQRQMQPVLVLSGKGRKTLAAGLGDIEAPIFDDLSAFALHQLKQQ